VIGEAWIWIALGAVALGGVLSALVHALSDLSRSAIEEIAAQRGRVSKDRHLRVILEDLTGHAQSVALLRIGCNALAAVATTLWIAHLRGVEQLGWVEVVIGVPIAALTVWLFGLVIPSSVARHAGELAVYTFAPQIRFVHALTIPVQAVARFFDEVVRRLSGQTQNEAEEIKEEVLSVVEEGRQEGRFDEAERDMIEAVVRFRETTVAQIMTPRTEMEAMELTNELGKVTAKIRSGGHSRIPVYEGTIDRVVGIFYVKDLMRWLAGDGSRGGRTFNLRQILRPALFVPETKTVRELLGELLQKRVHIAIVADEFGGTAGLVTIEDIIEEVFGDIQDEYETPGGEVEDVEVDSARGEAVVDARAYIKDVNDELRALGIELPESEEYDTVGGFVTLTLGRIPPAGETFQHGMVEVRVLDAEPTRVTRVKLTHRDADEAVVPTHEAGQGA
jgi:putative hemolysin